MAYITCKDLTLGYEGHGIVSDLNFKVSKGDYLCIVGEKIFKMILQREWIGV